MCEQLLTDRKVHLSGIFIDVYYEVIYKQVNNFWVKCCFPHWTFEELGSENSVQQLCHFGSTSKNCQVQNFFTSTLYEEERSLSKGSEQQQISTH